MQFPGCTRATRWEYVILKGGLSARLFLLWRSSAPPFTQHPGDAATPSTPCRVGDQIGIFSMLMSTRDAGETLPCLPRSSFSPGGLEREQRQRLARSYTPKTRSGIQTRTTSTLYKLVMLKFPRTQAKKDSEDHLTKIQANNYQKKKKSLIKIYQKWGICQRENYRYRKGLLRKIRP